MGAGSALLAAGPVALASRNGGATWGGMQTLDSTGALNSVSCATPRNCWAAGAGTSVSLAGTSNGGRPVPIGVVEPLSRGGWTASQPPRARGARRRRRSTPLPRPAWPDASACAPHQVSDNPDNEPGIVAVNVMPGVHRYHVCAVR